MNHNIIAEIIEDVLPFIKHINSYERNILNQIIFCQTSSMGGHKYKCIKCGRLEIFYNSCHNRHCPNCQSALRIKWVRKRLLELLPVQYFHAVFTLPKPLSIITLYNKKIMLKLLFNMVHETLKQAAKDKRNLGADIGGISVLHTWDQKLNYHPHIHSIIPGGGINPDKKEWIECKHNFFISVKKLSIIFRSKMLEKLWTIYDDLKFSGEIKQYGNKNNFKELLHRLKKKSWVVYCKKPFADAGKIVNYLGKYTHRIGISNNRIISYKNGIVCFSYTDRKTNKKCVCKLNAVTFVKCFILHILPKRFFKIRQFGILANSNRKKILPIVKKLIFEKTGKQESIIAEKYLFDLAIYEKEPEMLCSKCGSNLIYLCDLTRPYYFFRWKNKVEERKTG